LACTELTALLARLDSELAALCTWLTALWAALAAELAAGVLELLQPATVSVSAAAPATSDAIVRNLM